MILHFLKNDIFKVAVKQFELNLPWLWHLSWTWLTLGFQTQSLSDILNLLPSDGLTDCLTTAIAFQDGRLELKTSPQYCEFCLIHQSDEFIPTLTLTVHWFNWNWCALSLIYLKLTTAVHRLSHENDTWIEGVALTWSPVPHVTVTTLVHLIFTILIHLTESLTQSVTGKNSQYSPHGIAFPQIRKLLIIELSASLVFFCIFPNCHCEPD